MNEMKYEVREYINGRTDWNVWAMFVNYSDAEHWADIRNQDEPDNPFEVHRV